ncbi:CobW family GTP-binding protein [Siccibacter turicensis]|uniref:CobW family GTP-binding protein n=1 Tax=Siccibacter turicensis TaxID=357233 RepID=UPI003F57B08B
MTTAVSVTLLTGFLGAGKTTLLNHYLHHHADSSVVIVENEFGAVGIDGQLLARGDNIRVVEVSNGCVCCSVRGEFTEAMVDLLDRRASGEMPFETLIVEATGLADPGPIIQTFFTEERLRESLRLDAVITLVDCQHIGQQLDEHPVAAAQIAFADRLLLTKTDLCDEAHREAMLARVHRINNKAPLLAIHHGACPPGEWLNIAAFEMDDRNALTEGYHIISARADEPGRFRPFAATRAEPTPDVIQAHVFDAGTLDLKKIGAFMERCIADHGNDMLRYKGVLAIDGQPQRLVVQGVYKVVGFDYGSAWQESETPHSRLVIIGRYLPVEQLRRAFAATAS